MSDKLLEPHDAQYLLLSALLGDKPIIAAALLDSVDGVVAYAAVVGDKSKPEGVIYCNSLTHITAVTEAAKQVFSKSYPNCLPERFGFKLLKADAKSTEYDIEAYITTTLVLNDLVEMLSVVGHALLKGVTIWFKDEDEAFVCESLEAQGLLHGGVLTYPRNELTIPKLRGFLSLQSIKGVRAVGVRHERDTIYFSIKGKDVMVMMGTSDADKQKKPYAVFRLEDGLADSQATNLALRLRRHVDYDGKGILWYDTTTAALQEIGWPTLSAK